MRKLKQTDTDFLVNHSILRHHGEPWENVVEGIQQTMFSTEVKKAAIIRLRIIWEKPTAAQPLIQPN